MISQYKWNQLRKLMVNLNIHEQDLVEKFIVGSGSGGQKLHKTASCVYLKHEPTGIEVKCQETRFREDNRFHARRRLCEKVREKVHGEKTKAQMEAEKIRRQKQRRSRRSSQKILEEKSRRAEVKQLRKPPETE